MALNSLSCLLQAGPDVPVNEYWQVLHNSIKGKGLHGAVLPTVLSLSIMQLTFLIPVWKAADASTGSGGLTSISVILAAFALMENSWGGNAYSLPGTPREAGEEQETHSAPLNTREKLAGFYISPCEFEKEVAGVLNTKDSAFQEALLKGAF